MLEEKNKWIATETIATKKKHYFIDDSGESLCGKTFNTEKKVKGDNIPFCKECHAIVNNKRAEKKNNVNVKFEVPA